MLLCPPPPEQEALGPHQVVQHEAPSVPGQLLLHVGGRVLMTPPQAWGMSTGRRGGEARGHVRGVGERLLLPSPARPDPRTSLAPAPPQQPTPTCARHAMP